MDLLGLYDLIKYLEFGTKLHIGVVFLSNGRNSKCAIPHGHTIHSKPICEMLKKDPREYEKCLRCRNERLKRAIGEKAPFGEEPSYDTKQEIRPVCRSLLRPRHPLHVYVLRSAE